MTGLPRLGRDGLPSGTHSAARSPISSRAVPADLVRAWSDKTEVAAERFIAWLGIAPGKFFAWRKRYRKANEHNG